MSENLNLEVEAIMKRTDNPEIARYLDSLPGYPENLDRVRPKAALENFHSAS